MADSSKFGRKSPNIVCGLERVDKLITDADIDPVTSRAALHIALLTVYTSLKVVTPAFRSMPSVPINSLILMADSSKFGRKSPNIVCGLERVDKLITDADIEVWRPASNKKLLMMFSSNDDFYAFGFQRPLECRVRCIPSARRCATPPAK
jgi:hypothetical protein